MHCTNAFQSSIARHSFLETSNLQAKASNFQSLKSPTSSRSSAASSIGTRDRAERSRRSHGKHLPLPVQVDTITSTSNPFVKHCLKLRQDSAYRHVHGSVLVVGSTPISEICRFHEAIQVGERRIECLLLLDEADIPEELYSHSARLVRVSAGVMKKLSGVQSIECIKMIALIGIPSTFRNVNNDNPKDCHQWFPLSHRVLVLDGIQDPGNLGTLIRSAMAFGWDGIFLLPGCCDPFNEKALRASRGASFQLPIATGSWMHLEALRNEFNMKTLAGHPATNDGQHKAVSWLSQGLAESLADTPLCLILGSEGGGLSKTTMSKSKLVSIPMAGNFESLNVSVAGGIMLYMLQPENHKISCQ